MKDIVADSQLVAYCGLYCGSCGAYLKEQCPGCHKNEKASWCKIRKCNTEKQYASCADCKQYTEPNDCRMFNNFMSKVFALLFGSDRAACIAQIREMGVAGHAQNMAETRRQSIKRK
jgi:hypothetical protein